LQSEARLISGFGIHHCLTPPNVGAAEGGAKTASHILPTPTNKFVGDKIEFSHPYIYFVELFDYWHVLLLKMNINLNSCLSGS